MKCESVFLVIEDRNMFLWVNYKSFCCQLFSRGKKTNTFHTLTFVRVFMYVVAWLKKAAFSLSALLSCPWPAAALVVQSQFTAQVKNENLNIGIRQTLRLQRLNVCWQIQRRQPAASQAANTKSSSPTGACQPVIPERHVEIHFPTFAVVPRAKNKTKKEVCCDRKFQPSPCHFLLLLIFFPHLHVKY